MAAEHGAGLTLNAAQQISRRSKVRLSSVRKSGRKGIGLKVFETSGTPQGQQTAYRTGRLRRPPGGGGLHRRRSEIRLSNLMAFDATAHGNWGSCPPRGTRRRWSWCWTGRSRSGRSWRLSPWTRHRRSSRRGRTRDQPTRRPGAVAGAKGESRARSQSPEDFQPPGIRFEERPVQDRERQAGGRAPQRVDHPRQPAGSSTATPPRPSRK